MKTMSVYGLHEGEVKLVSRTLFMVDMPSFREKVKGCILCDLSKYGIEVTSVELEEGIVTDVIC